MKCPQCNSGWRTWLGVLGTLTCWRCIACGWTFQTREDKSLWAKESDDDE